MSNLFNVSKKVTSSVPLLAMFAVFGKGAMDMVEDTVEQQGGMVRKATIIDYDGRPKETHVGETRSASLGIITLIFLYMAFQYLKTAFNMLWHDWLIFTLPIFTVGFCAQFSTTKIEDAIKAWGLNESSDPCPTFLLAGLISVGITIYTVYAFPDVEKNWLFYLISSLLVFTAVFIGFFYPLASALTMLVAYYRDNDEFTEIIFDRMSLVILISSLIAYDLYQALQGRTSYIVRFISSF